jgi:hypothetical protein
MKPRYRNPRGRSNRLSQSTFSSKSFRFDLAWAGPAGANSTRYSMMQRKETWQVELSTVSGIRAAGRYRLQ